ncbi:MAG: hypothetical protein ACK56I_10595, partial [bacterium]
HCGVRLPSAWRLLDLGGGPLDQTPCHGLHAGVLVGVGEGVQEGRQLVEAALPGPKGALQGPYRLLAAEAEGTGEAAGPAQPLVHSLAQEAQMGVVAPPRN